ncbi:tyrosine-protein phosphatase [Pseudonocardia benzenivorans]
MDHLEHDQNLPVAVEAVAHTVRHPTLVHCAAGKDRTGMTILLVELLCGVTVEDTTADFLVTRRNMEAIRTRLRGWPRYAANMARLSAEIYDCEEHTIVGLLDELQRRYGTAAGWARAKEIPEESIALLRRRLVEQQPR